MRIRIKAPRIINDFFLTENIGFTLEKNIGQFLIGVFAFSITHFSINIITLLLGLASFLITYSSIYIFNDINDMSNDKRNSEKLEYKGLARGTLSIEKAVSLIFIVIITGFVLSMVINKFFTILLATSLFGNFLHSSAYTRFKTKSFKKVLLGKSTADFSKFALGWFSQTQNLIGFPLLLFITLSVLLSFNYYFYTKRRIVVNKNSLVVEGHRKAIAISVMILLFFIATLLFTRFKTVLLFISAVSMPLMLILVLRSGKKNSKELNITLKRASRIYISILIVSIVLYLSLNTPRRVDANINEHINKYVNSSVSQINALSHANEVKEIIVEGTHSLNDIITNKTVINVGG